MQPSLKSTRFESTTSVGGRLNNFDALRLCAALLVLYSHQYALGGMAQPEVPGGITLGTLGVLIFFSISGYLVSQSWRRDPHVGRFLAKRALRIWPGLAAFTLIAALVLGPLVTTLPLRAYFLSPEFYKFMESLKLFTIRHSLPGVFETNMHPKAVNGSLWTIPMEVRCYLALSVFGFIGLLRHRVLASLATLTFGVYYFGFAPDPDNFQFHFALYFFLGMCLDLWSEHWSLRPAMVLIGFWALAGLCYWGHEFRLATLLVVAPLTIFLGSQSTPIVKRFGRFGDLSYGIYVYAFAVQQTFFWVVGTNFPFLLGLLMTVAITVVCAWVSWHFVEQPSLRLKLRLNTSGST